MARTNQIKMVGGKHLQHTSTFINELHLPKNVAFTPFRISDEVWIVGKNKGIKLDNTPIEYIKWALNNMNLTETASSMLKEKINK